MMLTVETLAALAAEWRVRANVQLTERNGLQKSQKAVRAYKLRCAQIYQECAAALENASAGLLPQLGAGAPAEERTARAEQVIARARQLAVEDCKPRMDVMGYTAAVDGVIDAVRIYDAQVTSSERSLRP